MRKPFIAGNWKMNKTIKESIELANGLKRELIDLNGVDILVCPPYTALSDIADILVDSNIGLGAQNVSWQKEGAFTGEISVRMLNDAGCRYIIVGHSERRKYFSENDEIVNKKIKAVLSGNLTPIFCLGETLEERESNQTMNVIQKQLEGGLSGLDQESVSQLIIAYEPVWAIGTGKTASPDQAQQVHQFIRNWIKSNYSEEVSEELKIIYGGSVKADNTKELMQKVDIDGALVGGAALEIDSFAQIAKAAL